MKVLAPASNIAANICLPQMGKYGSRTNNLGVPTQSKVLLNLQK